MQIILSEPHQSIEEQDADPVNFISTYVDTISDQLRHISLSIHDNPELKYEEFFAHKTLTNFLASCKGWKVTPSVYGIATAFIAEYDNEQEGPVISFNAEYDALTGIGHACGHNLIAIASVAAALAAGAAIDRFKLPGKVILYGTPAEEGGGGKIKLLQAGAYSEHKVDLSLITHPAITSDCALVTTNAYIDFQVEYFGREAHAAASPWEGINALDALIIAYNALSVLRQQTMPGDIIQGHITDGGLKPNIIHAHSAGAFAVRATTRDRLAVLFDKVRKCFEAGASATGAHLKITTGMSYADHVPNKSLGFVCGTMLNRIPLANGDETPIADLTRIRATAASTDQGDISYAMPSVSLSFNIPGDKGPHHPSFAVAARTRAAHVRALRAGKALAATGVRVLGDVTLLKVVRKEWEDMMRERGSDSKYVPIDVVS